MGTKTQNAADAQSAAFFAFSFGKEGIYYYLYILLNGREIGIGQKIFIINSYLWP